MKALQFNVTGQILVRTDNIVIVADSKNYLYINFDFNEEWEGLNKTAIFYWGKETPKYVIIEYNKCKIPDEVIKSPCFYVSVFGGDLITTNQVRLNIIPSGLKGGETPSDPTPDVYNQILGVANEAKTISQGVRSNADAGEFRGEKGDVGLPGADGKDGLTTSVNNIEQVKGNINLTTDDIPQGTTNKYYPRLVQDITLSSAVSAITITQDLSSKAINLKRAEFEFYVPALPSVANNATGSLRVRINDRATGYIQGGATTYTLDNFMIAGSMRNLGTYVFGHFTTLLDRISMNSRYIAHGYAADGVNLATSIELHFGFNIATDDTITKLYFFTYTNGGVLPQGTKIKVWGIDA